MQKHYICFYVRSAMRSRPGFRCWISRKLFCYFIVAYGTADTLIPVHMIAQHVVACSHKHCQSAGRCGGDYIVCIGVLCQSECCPNKRKIPRVASTIHRDFYVLITLKSCQRLSLTKCPRWKTSTYQSQALMLLRGPLGNYR